MDYHVLVTGFLHGLCERTRAEAYCATARRFARYLKTPPALSLLTTGVAAGGRRASASGSRRSPTSGS